jgi:hypothetical protein
MAITAIDCFGVPVSTVAKPLLPVIIDKPLLQLEH